MRLAPLDRAGRQARAWPFAVSAALVPATVALPYRDGHPVEMLIAGLLCVVLAAVVMWAPLARLQPAWQIAPPLAFFVVIGLLRDASGGASSGTAALALLPVLWLALYGTPTGIAVGLLAQWVTLLLPPLAIGGPHYPLSEWRSLLPLLGISPLMAFTVHGLVSQLRCKSEELARRVRERESLLGALRELSSTDALTGLPNRRAWEHHLRERLTWGAAGLCVVVLDLDRFKAFNDDRGHQAGDRLLKEAAVAWRASVRGDDFIARYGGDEFVLALRDVSAEDARTLVARIRSATPPGHTCSAGVAYWDGSEDADSLLLRADNALYAAKRAGRDRTEVAA
ncbi:MAG TPA: GGDEF domain-containing protein [Solirubrobacteraceae bacterium]|jgi:diguanylate cyclase (GGDEF)-like protein|nr:GGDEF domain-containing protein [Solirubrobacteraceae bacterium]